MNGCPLIENSQKHRTMINRSNNNIQHPAPAKYFFLMVENNRNFFFFFISMGEESSHKHLVKIKRNFERAPLQDRMGGITLSIDFPAQMRP